MNKDRRLRQTRGKKDWRKISAAVVAGLLIVAMGVGMLFPNADVLKLQAQTSDAMTSDTWKQSLGDEVSTQYAGRIWTDKSVYSEDTSFELYAPEGEEHPIANIKLEEGEDFLVAYSALATAQAISGQTQAPVDVVFVVDISGSMTYNMQDADGNNSTRIAETIKALNAAIDTLMNMNKNTRVGVVVFSNQAETILPLGHYEKGTRKTAQGATVTNYFSLAGNALYTHVFPVTGYDADGEAITGTQINEERTVTGGTNIQRGIHEGMNILATEESTTVDINGQEIQRYPSVVLLSDGAPTYSSDSESWWSPGNNNNDGPGGSPYYGNGMKALMTGAYMKNAIDKNYDLAESPIGTTFYTIGMGITGLSNYSNNNTYTGEQDLAYMTLNPGVYWKDKSTSESISAGEYQPTDFEAETEERNTGISSITCTRIVVDENGDATAVLSIRRSNNGANISSVTVNGTSYTVSNAGNRTFAVEIPIVLNGKTTITIKNANNNFYEYTLTVSLDPNANSTMAERISEAWKTYATNEEPKVDTNSNETYTFTHPSENDILGTYTYKVLENGEMVEKKGNALQALVDSYYDADDASSVGAVFNQIVTNIALNTAQVPTAIQTGKTLDSTGWITYEDPIGEYMEVKNLKQLIYGGHQFSLEEVKEGEDNYPTNITVPENATVYVAHTHLRDENNTDTEIHSGVYAGSDAADIIVMIKEETVDSVKKQTLYVYVPASTIPVRVNTITLKTAVDANGNEYEYVADHTNNGTYPLRVVYSVGLQEGVMKTVETEDGKAEVVDTEVVSADYLAKNTNTSDGSVNFYSNYYDGTNADTLLDGKTYTAGNAKVTFVPALTNPFYYLQEDTPIYTDSECTIPASTNSQLDDNTTYYYKDTYYYLKDEVTTALERTGAQLKNSGVIEINGVWHRQAGTVRLNRIVALVSPKTENTTNTAELSYAPKYDKEYSIQEGTTGHMTVWLGNNGVLTKAGSGVLEISKSVTADTGLTAPIPENGFEFTIELPDNTYSYDVLDTATQTVLERRSVTVTDGSGKIYLKAGETARIIGLMYGTEYRITEAPVAGYKTTPAEATGEIVVGKIAEADFNNHYFVTSTTWPTDGGITGTKKLAGRAWSAEQDTYTFLLTPFNNAPLPDGQQGQVAVTVTGENVDGTTVAQSFNLGQITFTAPGVYRYTVVEKEPVANTEIPGISYSRALYRIVVTVTDNGAGALVATTDIQQLYDNGGVQLFKYDADNNIVVDDPTQDEIEFINTYSAESVTKVPVAVKDYTDKSGQKPLTSGMFEFKLTPMGIKTGDSVDTSAEAVAKVPMPLDSSGKKLTEVITTNEGVDITFLPITFTQSDLGENYSEITYQYKIEEIPGSIPGMKYATEPEYIDVTLFIDESSHVLTVHASYENLPGGEYRLPTFVNVYEPAPATVKLEGQKILNGRDMKEGESYTFSFNVTDNDAFTSWAIREPQKYVEFGELEAEVSGGKNGEVLSFDFGEWTFEYPGTYRFSIFENIAQSEKDGVTYDNHYADVVIVIEDINGQLTATSITYDNSTAANADAAAITDKAAFVNTYEATFVGATVSLDGTKNLTGQTLEAQEFRFGITSDIDEETGKAKADATWHYVTNHDGTDEDGDGTYTGTISFLKDVSYTHAGTYTYLISEYIPANPILGMTNDTTVYKLEVVVNDDGKGNLYVGDSKDVDTDGITVYKSTDYHTATVATWTSLTTEEKVVFNNSYTPVPVVRLGSLMTKILDGDRQNGTSAKPVQEGEFTFKRSILSATSPDGIILMKDETTLADQENDIAKNNADGTFSFGPMKFTKAGTYVVQIEEVIPSDAVYDILVGAYVKDGVYYTAKPLTATFVVEDDQRGTLTVRAINVTGSTFVNTYKTSGILELFVKKDFTGRKDSDADNQENWLDKDAFKFTIAPADTVTELAIEAGDIVLPTEAVTIDKTTEDRQAGFEDIYFYKPGTYTFVITEDRSADILGVNYAAPRELTVTARDEGNGDLVITYDMLDTTVVQQESPITFKNVYDTASTTLSGHFNLIVDKDFTGRVDDNPDNLDNWMTTDSFTFKLEAGDSDTAEAIQRYADTKNSLDIKGIELPANASELIVTKENIHHAHFDAITFHETGKFVFKVTEILPSAATAENNHTVNGITYTTVEKTVEVIVTDDGDGTLTAVRTNPNELLTFVNTYAAQPGSLNGATYLEVTKKLTGRDWNGDEFTFELKAEGPTTQAAIDAGDIELPEQKITIDEGALKDGAYAKAFGNIIFNKPGTYGFEISEIIPENATDGIAYDDHNAVVVVTVYDDGNGQLVVANPQSQANEVPSYTGSMTFTNVYTPDTQEISLTGEKVINGRDITENDSFTFTIEVADGSKANTPLPSVTRVQNSKDKISFGPIVFGADKSQEAGYAEGIYKYIIHESAGTDGVHGITTDKGYVVATVAVDYDEESGQYIVAQPTYVKVNLTGEETGFTFVNTYKATGVLEGRTNLKVTKNFTGRVNNEWLESDKFVFTLAIDTEHDATKAAYEAGDIVLPNANLNQESGLYELTVTKTNKDNAYFGDITFNKKGDYQFIVQEADSEVAGITYDTAKRIVKVKADDNGDGTLTVTVVGIQDEQGDSSSLTFNNTYDTTETVLEGAANLKVTKNFTGRVNNEWLDSDKFVFTLAIDEAHAATKAAYEAGNIALPSANLNQESGLYELTVTKNNKDNAYFGNITFKEPGLYKFVVTEAKGDYAYIKYDTTPRVVWVNVVDNNDGTMTATVVADDSDALQFTNTYVVNSVTATLSGTKTIDGRDLKDTDKFNFTITAVTENAPMPENTTVQNAADGTISFAPITYKKAGTYVYEIRETGGSVTGVTNATNVVTATVTIKDDAEGQLDSAVAYSAGGFKFVNVYKTTPTDLISIVATKKVTPSEGNSYKMSGGEFEFTIKPANPDGNPITENTVSNDANGNVVFASDVQFDKAGTYVYVVEEKDGTLGGMSYSQTVYTITVTVTDDEANAKLGAVITVEEGVKGQNVKTSVTDAVTVDSNKQIITLSFENNYNPEKTDTNISGKKELNVTGNPKVTLKEGNFTFKLEAVDNAPMPKNEEGQVVDTVKNDATGSFAFEKIIYTAPGTYHYKVTEVNDGKKGYTYDDTVYDVTITVEDKSGELTVTENTSGAETVVFENSYKPDSVTLQGETAIKGTKKLTGRDMKAEEFNFTITAVEEDNPMPENTVVKNAKDGSFSFERITFTSTGVYTYTIIEQKGTLGGVTYDEQVYTVTVTVTDKGGYLAADVVYPENGVVFENAYEATIFAKVSLDAKKTLAGRNLVDGEFTFQLIDKEGHVVATATNSANGAILFETLTFDKAGEYVYTVKEVKGNTEHIIYDEAAYTVKVKVVDDLNGSLQAETILEKDGKAVEAMEFVNTYKVPAPQTGDAVRYLPVMMMLLLAAGSVTVALKKRRVIK